MRSTLTFLIGCVIGATGILMYLTETQQLAMAATPSPMAVPHPSLPAPLSDDVPLIPVAGVRADALHSTFTAIRGGFRLHHALDILAPRGTPVLAAVDGTIRKLFFSRAGGITIYEFDRSAARIYYYAHLERYADGIREGMRVSRGDVIGYVGTTGNAPANTPHLHFAIYLAGAAKKWSEGTPIDPYPLLTQKRASAPQSHPSR